MFGVCIDWDEYDKKDKEVSILISNIQNEIRKELNLDFDIILDDEIPNEEASFFESTSNKINVNSNDILGKLLEEKGLKDYGRNKKGIYNVNDDTLSKWVTDKELIAEMITKLHEYQTLHKTFIKGIEKFKYTYDKRIHNNWYIGLAESWRTRSQDINLQNLPSRGYKSEIIKSFYSVPDKDYKIFSFDSSGIQLRLFAMVNNDPVFRDVFINQGGDLHSKTACSVIMNNKVTFEEFLKRKKEPEFKQARLKAKNFNFALIFLGSEYTIKTTVIEKDWLLQEQLDFIKENKLDVILDKLGKPDYALTVARETRKRFFKTYFASEQ
jgi:DNA polymerase I-like protein with 3'-5' exonuclease and polymerase domains